MYVYDNFLEEICLHEARYWLNIISHVAFFSPRCSIKFWSNEIDF